MIKGLINTLNHTLYLKYKKRTQLQIKKKQLYNLRIGATLFFFFYLIAKGKFCRKFFSGFCIRKKINQINTSATIKKIKDKTGININFPLFSPIIFDFIIRKRYKELNRKFLKKLKKRF